MRVHVVSDIHGNVDALARAGDGADALFVLGDLLNFIDYYEHHNGIFGALFGAEKVGVLASLRGNRNLAERIAFSRSLWASLGDARAAVNDAVRQQYAELFAAMTAPTYAIPGNVDSPELWAEFASDEIHLVDGEVIELGGLRCGFAGSALEREDVPVDPDAPWGPFLRTKEAYEDHVALLKDVDVLCSHIPPAIPELTYDVLAHKTELGSDALLQLIAEQQPRWSLFGHIHQPLANRARIGTTECRNVGHFQRTGKPYVLQW